MCYSFVVIFSGIFQKYVHYTGEDANRCYDSVVKCYHLVTQ